MKKMVLFACAPFFALIFCIIVIMIVCLGVEEETPVVDGFIWPKEGAIVITSVFGDRVHPITGRNDHHDGIDIAASFTEDVLASKGGEIAIATYHESYGNYILIDHGDGYKTLYAHMAALSVPLGDVVAQGETIGLAGSTGTSTGVHIHFEVWLDGERTDPLEYFAEDTYMYG